MVMACRHTAAQGFRAPIGKHISCNFISTKRFLTARHMRQAQAVWPLCKHRNFTLLPLSASGLQNVGLLSPG